MIFIDNILKYARANGFGTHYGSVSQLNDFFTDTDFSEYYKKTAIFCHLITSSATVNGYDRAEVAVYYARLCDFDFNPESLLEEQEELKDLVKKMFFKFNCGNELKTVGDVRWQYGYNDFAENVMWVAARVTLSALAADCVNLNEGC